MSFYGMKKKHKAINTSVNSTRQKKIKWKKEVEKRSGTF